MRKFLFLLILLPTLSKAQNANNWQLLLHNKVVIEGTIGQIKNYSVPTNEIEFLKLKSSADNNWKQFNRSYLIMDTARVERNRKAISTKKSALTFTKSNFGTEDNYNPIVVYVVSKPSNMALAGKVRVRPVPLVKIIPTN